MRVGHNKKGRRKAMERKGDWEGLKMRETLHESFHGGRRGPRDEKALPAISP